MNPRILGLLIAFLAGFVLLSQLSALPAALHALPALPALDRLPDLDRLGDVLLGTAAGLCFVLLGIVLRRRVVASRQVHPFSQARARQAAPRPAVALARRAPAAVARSTRPSTTAGVTAPQSELQGKIRSAARKGEKVAALARRHRLSVDAIRTALGELPSAPAALRGSSFRSRQQSLPAARPATAIPARRNPYGALA